ncbi:hypothetical protein PAHAL_4G131700 [Panicum hallii]|uniref:Uncharacterized protein n=1 Tax=Panicum hallii TaxID=206008 RepID=A0A2S3HIZ3_9POAL|nr:hypothetical protein PAHAL_4G131700 [Panicum hallii]
MSGPPHDRWNSCPNALVFWKDHDQAMMLFSSDA